MPLELGKKVGQAAHAAWGQRSQSALLPLPLPAQGRPCDDRRLVVEEKAEEGGVA